MFSCAIKQTLNNLYFVDYQIKRCTACDNFTTFDRHNDLARRKRDARFFLRLLVPNRLKEATQFIQRESGKISDR